MVMKAKVRVGDVFLIPIDELRWGSGQVAGNWMGELYIIIFGKIYEDADIDPKKVISEEPILAALSLDAKIHNGSWPIIGNVETNLPFVPQPIYKVNQDGKVFIETRDRSVSRMASRAESNFLRFRTVIAPIRLENALKAHFGIGDWKPIYDDLLFRYATDSARIIVS